MIVEVLNKKGTVIDSISNVLSIEKLRGVGSSDCIGIISAKVKRLVDLDEGKTVILKSESE
jgi:hypothetical protein